MTTRLADNWTELLAKLASAHVEFIVVGGVAAILNDVVYRTDDMDVVHRRTPENIERRMAVLESLDAHFRNDLMQRTLRPRASDFAGHGHSLLRTTLGKLDVLLSSPGSAAMKSWPRMRARSSSATFVFACSICRC